MSNPAPVQLSHGDTSETVRIVINNGGENGNVAFEGDASSGAGWTTTLMDPTRSTTGPEQRKVMFNTTSFSSHGDGSYVITVDSATHTIRFKLADGVQLSKATWKAKSTSGNETVISTVSASQENPGVGSGMTTFAGALPTAAASGVRRQESNAMTLNNDNLVMPINAQEMSIYANYTMYIELQWISETKSGTTTSGAFAVFTGAYPSEEYNQTVGRLADKRGSSATEASGSEDESDSTSTLPTSVIQATATSTASLNPNASQTTISGGSSSSSGSGGSGGLAPGAIAGIVIGTVLGLALIAFLLWFLLRRRRRRADHVSDGVYGPGHNPHGYLADKETHARVTESPRSPYTDDGQHQHRFHQPQQPQEQHHLAREFHQDDHGRDDALEAGGAVPASAVSATEHHQRPFAPYSEEHTSMASRSAEDMTRSGGGGPRSSTPNVNSNVAHLIEDGMTEDEIRRLEEEERALDAAIEQAGPRRKP
ncbi:hypothetical protein CORC01_13618 [Colletotrichum orchidophilum]|uniref:Uncharacterized protein n=1 Tax=Colletotrichum orchidophilum TaxID=1209926 RepID=A0A1G4APK9_9PEZI|nr:uncharacterized protein CORC01_13618 [Colletotrichum orchidophilum]OHE91099.1 hypothetical protein CORC01_13618 [Colletotrichum orchidophilum]